MYIDALIEYGYWDKTHKQTNKQENDASYGHVFYVVLLFAKFNHQLTNYMLNVYFRDYWIPNFAYDWVLFILKTLNLNIVMIIFPK